MTDEGRVRVTSAGTEPADGGLTVRVTVRNDDDRTMYAYGRARRVTFDATTGVLRLALHDNDADPLVDRHLKRPPIVELPPRADADVAVTLPPVIRRIRSREETGGGPPQVELIRPARARAVEVEVAVADTPFYDSVGEALGPRLREWTVTVLTTRIERDTGPDTDGDVPADPEPDQT